MCHCRTVDFEKEGRVSGTLGSLQLCHCMDGWSGESGLLDTLIRLAEWLKSVCNCTSIVLDAFKLTGMYASASGQKGWLFQDCGGLGNKKGHATLRL